MTWVTIWTSNVGNCRQNLGGSSVGVIITLSDSTIKVINWAATVAEVPIPRNPYQLNISRAGNVPSPIYPIRKNMTIYQSMKIRISAVGY